MRLLNSVVFLLLMFINIQGQIYVPPSPTYDSGGKDTISAINSYSNTLYAGIDNRIEIIKKNVPFKNIVIECSMGIVMEDEGYYDIIPAKPGNVVVSVYQYDKGDTVLYFQKTMNVKRLPAPYISIANFKLTDHKCLTKKILSNPKGFEVHLSEDIIDDNKWFSVKEITIGYTVGQSYISKSCEGPFLSEELLNMIDKLIPSSEIFLSFTIAGSGDLLKRMPPIKLQVY